jgi:RecJ-like exonuclease
MSKRKSCQKVSVVNESREAELSLTDKEKSQTATKAVANGSAKRKASEDDSLSEAAVALDFEEYLGDFRKNMRLVNNVLKALLDEFSQRVALFTKFEGTKSNTPTEVEPAEVEPSTPPESRQS